MSSSRLPFAVTLILGLAVALSAAAATPSLGTIARGRLMPAGISVQEAFPGADAAGRLFQSGKPAEALLALDQSTAAAGGAVQDLRQKLLRGVLLAAVDRPGEAVKELAAARTGLPLLQDVVDVHLGAALAASGNPEQGSAILRGIPVTSPLYRNAVVSAIQLDLERGATAQALLGVGALVGDKPWDALDPPALLLLGQALEAGAGDNTDDLVKALRAYQLIDARSPRSRQASTARGRIAALAQEKSLHPPALTFEDRDAGARYLLALHLNEDAVRAFTELLQILPKDDPLRCSASMNLARAHQKQRQYTESIPWLEKADSSLCDPGTRVTSLFLLGRAYARKGEDKNALRVYAALVERFPDHSMADDALLLSAAIHQDNDEQAQAEALLRRQLDVYPDGDMAADAAWRLAWAAHHQDRTAEAVEVLSRLLASGGELSVDDELQARYWVAWFSHALARDAEGRLAALDKLEALARAAPLHYYGLMAARRLASLDAARGEALATALPPPTADGLPAALDAAALGARLERAVSLYSAGLRAQSLQILEDRDFSALDDAHRMAEALIFEAMGLYHKSTWVGRVVIGDARIVRPADGIRWLAVGYPLPWADTVSRYAADNGVDPNLLMGLMREESNFDPWVRSWAGASGLTQLMWPTAQETARKLGIRVSRQSLMEPASNIRIGARYLGDLLKRYDRSAGLAVPGYNAGAGSVNRWLKERGDLEFDAWVEEIPYDQTRDYVRRVLGSYQTYHHLYRDAGTSPWIDLPLKLP